jgi:hypothetical protein
VLVVVLLPFQPLDPAWQWRLSNALINSAPLPLLALALLLRNGLSCLLLATAYAAFARRAGSDLSLLAETQLRLQGLGVFRSRRAGSSSQADYMRQLSGKEE